MRFARLIIHPTNGLILGVAQLDRPFDNGVGEYFIDGVRAESAELGVVDEHEWTDAAGSPADPAKHMHHRLLEAMYGRGSVRANLDAMDKGQKPKITGADAKLGGVTAAHVGVAELIDCPCTSAAIKAKVQAAGVDAIPRKVRAWIACVLSDEHPLIRDTPIATGLTLVELRQAELERSAVDAQAGPRLDAIAQRVEERRKRALARAAAQGGA